MKNLICEDLDTTAKKLEALKFIRNDYELSTEFIFSEGEKKIALISISKLVKLKYFLSIPEVICLSTDNLNLVNEQFNKLFVSNLKVVDKEKITT